MVQNPYKNGLQRAPWWHLNHIPRTSTKLCENVLYTPQTKNPQFLNAPKRAKYISERPKMAANGRFRAAYRGRKPSLSVRLKWSPCSQRSMLTFSHISHSREFKMKPDCFFSSVLPVFEPSLFFVWIICKDADMFYINLHFVVCL